MRCLKACRRYGRRCPGPTSVQCRSCCSWSRQIWCADARAPRKCQSCHTETQRKPARHAPHHACSAFNAHTFSRPFACALGQVELHQTRCGSRNICVVYQNVNA
eukprot:766771-Amphidinium_carterae.1